MGAKRPQEKRRDDKSGKAPQKKLATHKKVIHTLKEKKQMEKDKKMIEKKEKIGRQKIEELREIKKEEEIDAEGYFILPDNVTFQKF